ncbi:MAG: hypothetical protein NTZ73_03430 [Candidatus Diapherotrites archaeon]|nr:hypothetical protein [Candidatus Diapherotrites archaeon]
MALGSFLRPTEAFENAIAEENLGAAVGTAIIAGLLFGIGGLILTGSALQFVINFATPIMQWIVLSLLVWIFYFMFKKKKLGELSLAQIASATGVLWGLFVIAGIIATVGAFVIAGLGNTQIMVPIAIVLFALICIVGLVFLFDWFVLIKTILDAENKKAVIVWALLFIVHGLLFIFINSALSSAFL